MPDTAPYELDQLLDSGTLGRPIQELAPVALTPQCPGLEANQDQMSATVGSECLITPPTRSYHRSCFLHRRPYLGTPKKARSTAAQLVSVIESW
jgi:hypothetical protein